MNIKDIRQLVKLMVDNDLGELEIADGDSRVHLKRATDLPTGAVVHQLPPEPPPAASAPRQAAEEAAPTETLIDIRSPMVGTYYSAPSPDTDSYIQVGDLVSEDSVVCIVEAMKVMNEIKAECAGTVAEICVKNAQPVEFGQVLFRVRPA